MNSKTKRDFRQGVIELIEVSTGMSSRIIMDILMVPLHEPKRTFSNETHESNKDFLRQSPKNK